MTMRQIRLLFGECMKKARRERAARIVDVSAGFNRAKQMVKDLSK